jgi:hypothetical protein
LKSRALGRKQETIIELRHHVSFDQAKQVMYKHG